MVLIHAGYFSHELGMCMQSDVLLPQSEGPHRVLWLLHGASDDETAWQRRTSIERYVEGTGLAVVMPCGHLSSYVNMAHGGKYFSYIADELPTIMRGFFSLSDKREDNFIAAFPWAARARCASASRGRRTTVPSAASPPAWTTAAAICRAAPAAAMA